MSGLGNGFVNLFKGWGKGIGNAVDKFLLSADARKAISDEVEKKFQPMIERAQRYESKRAANIKDLGDKITQSKEELTNAQKAWQDKYNSELAAAQTKRQTDINDYDAKLKGYQNALTNARAGKQDILDQLYDSEAQYTPSRTVFTDVNTGENYIFDPFSGGYRKLNSLNKKERKKFLDNYVNFDTRLFDSNNNRVLNPFDKSTRKAYKGSSVFDNYYSTKISTQNTALRNANNEINRADNDLTNWKINNSQPQAWDASAEKQFTQDFKKNNAKPTYSFNGQTYSKEADLDKAYKDALAHEQYKMDFDNKAASRYVSKRDAEIAQHIQDAKDIKKAKLALGGALGAGALYAGAKAMYGGDDTDNIDNTNNIDNTDNTYTGKPDPAFNVENTPEGKAALNGKSIDSDFDPDKAEAKAILAGAAYDTGVEDSNSIESSGDLGNNIGATTRGHTMEDKLYELIKAMEDPYKADAVANYIYSRHGDDPEVQRLGWRGWLNKYYGDSLRSRMNINPSGYKGMHVSGGL